MKVFRIEDERGAGMYRSGKSVIFSDICWPDRSHPSPWEDIPFGYSMRAYDRPDIVHHRFGFASLEQLRRWIYKDEWLVELHHAGYRLSIYEVDPYNVIIGESQCAFLFHSHIGVEYHSISTFFLPAHQTQPAINEQFA